MVVSLFQIVRNDADAYFYFVVRASGIEANDTLGESVLVSMTGLGKRASAEIERIDGPRIAASMLV